MRWGARRRPGRSAAIGRTASRAHRGVAIAVLLAALTWNLLGHRTAAAAARLSTKSTGLIDASPTAPAGLRYRVDYSFLQTAPDGRPDRWSCARPIPVQLAGPVPGGGTAALTSAVDAVRAASGLPLVVGPQLPNAILAPGDVSPGTIAVSYLTAAQLAAAHLTLGSGSDLLGRGGPDFTDTGTIMSGWIILRSGGDVTPTSLIGLHTIWHELGHAVNLGHSKQQTGHIEVMEPTFDPRQTTMQWGPGDRYALSAIGCTRPARKNPRAGS